jgi:ATP-dependent exoDNAse (exonuclease V) alpha subunit
MHRSKGLEFDEVVLLLPRNINGSQAKKDNMKKLIYVAITRAKKLATVLRY